MNPNYQKSSRDTNYPLRVNTRTTVQRYALFASQLRGELLKNIEFGTI